MLTTYLWLSLICFVAVAVFSAVVSSVAKRRYNIFNLLLVGTVVASMLMFIPIHAANNESLKRIFMLSLFNTIQLFTAGCDFISIPEALANCPALCISAYKTWASILYVVAPLFTFGFVLSLFKNVFAYIRYIHSYFRDVYVFSELNEKSFALASDIKNNHRKAAIVFTDIFDEDEEKMYELLERTKDIGAVNFKKDILVIDFNKHSKDKKISFFAIGENETENLNHALKLVETYKNRENTHLFVFSTKIESEILLASAQKGGIRVRRVNEVQSLVNRILYESGNLLFESASDTKEGHKDISAIVVGMGSHGTEFVKALTWFGQMDGYKLKINAFDKDPLAEEKFTALVPELMDSKYNGVCVAGEAEYKITVHSGMDVFTKRFADEIKKITDATFVIVALGNDDVNLNTAVNLRMYFERMGIHPVIQSIIYNSQQRKALKDIVNFKGHKYDIDFVGDVESSYTEGVIINSEVEEDALKRHKKWGNEDEFWQYEYNYRSSIASAIHMKARIACGIPGADKKEEELTEKERNIIETLEHRRWNAYMRAEGYVYSGSKDKSSRNDLAKMHHDLVDYASLSDEEKRKDSRIGTN